MSIAEELAKKQKEISVAQFFEKNKQILGFDSPQKSLLMAVKEAVDNALDACEEARIQPEIEVALKNVEKNEYLLIVEDNGPGIVRKEVPKIFGQFLYGSRFYSMRQSRGQQGIGISAVVLYSQITTGKPTVIISKTADMDVAYKLKMFIDTKENRASIVAEDVMVLEKKSGLRLEIFLAGKYIRGKQSVIEYLQNTAIVNPHAKIRFTDPDSDSTITFERVSEKVPVPPVEMKPHPHGLEIGEVLAIAKNTRVSTMIKFLNIDFSKVSNKTAAEICAKSGLNEKMDPKSLTVESAKKLMNAINSTKLMMPSSEALSPIGENLIKKGLKNVLGSLKPSFYAIPVSRKPATFHGNVFAVEVGMVYGGELPKEDPVKILRFANRVPLLYQHGACAITKAVAEMDWRRYGFEQKGGKGVPIGPAVLLVHVCATKVPFTSEAKEAIAEIPEIMNEIELGIRDIARQIKTFLTKKEVKVKLSEKFFLVQKILPKIAEKSAGIVNKPVPGLESIITQIMNVVWIDEEIIALKKSVKVRVKISNFTNESKSFALYADIPEGKVVKESIKNCRYDEEKDYLEWSIKLDSLETQNLEFEVSDAADTYKETIYYIEGINPVYVVGAEPLPGDWNIEDLKTIIEEEPEEDENDEIQ